MPSKPTTKKKASTPSHAFFDPQFSLPATEERVLAFWKEEDIFGQSLKLREKGKPFIFYEGPPGANGKPGIHHVLSRVYKDVVLRYRTMRGHYVPRKSGWDTHGLPVELAAEKELGMKDKKDIDKYGVAAFNKKCQELVWEHEAEWRDITERIGFWLDLENPYVTYAPDYIESLWWIVKQINERGHLYRGHKIIPWCTRCGTGLSAAEVALGYQAVDDMSVTFTFPLRPGQSAGKVSLDNASIAAWTTTPWTLPGNVALAVGSDIDYALVQRGGTRVIVAADLVAKHFGDDAEVVASVKGKDLVGLSYEPPFDVASLEHEKAHQVYAAGFVTTTDGTGIVHITTAYGEDDYNLTLEIGLPTIHTVDETGRFLAGVTDLAGLHVKDSTTEAKVLDALRGMGRLMGADEYRHEYPHCWRCSTPLLYYAKNSWFVAMSKLRAEMVARNQTVNWVPEHTKDGRFGNWLKEAKDWNFSRERYWGTPLPVWRCADCDTQEVIGSLDEMHERSGGTRNHYWLMRHGEADHNVKGVLDADGSKASLTDKGRKQAEKVARALRDQGIDLIVSSPAKRAQETAAIVAEVAGIPMVTYDERLREMGLGSFSGKKVTELHAFWKENKDAGLDLAYPGNGESENDSRRRGWYFLKEFEKSHEGRNVLVVGHDGPLRMMAAAAEGWPDQQILARMHELEKPFLAPGEMTRIDFRNIPRDEDGAVNLHRPYVDSVIIPCATCGKHLHRTPETIDVWYDSGAMPFAQRHYPFDGPELVDGDKETMKTFPADFIAEGVDQTRGWFYSLLEVATLLGRPAPYKNVISLGLLNDKHGKKMSKSKGNTIDPWEMINKYGVDAVRWYMYAGADAGDPKNFDEAELGKAVRRVHLIAYNTISFLKLYGDKPSKAARKLSALDRWILARRDETVQVSTKALETYDIRTAILAVESLVDDLSRWYVRSSRKRLQRPSSQADYAACVATLREVLTDATKLMAPFAPFFAEACYHELRSESDPVSVHLTDWPTAGKPDAKLVKNMAVARELAAAGLSIRAKEGLKVRQPLSSMTVSTKALDKEPELLALLAAEVNVKAVLSKASLGEVAVLDTELTPALVAEGAARELTRAIQGLRAEAGFDPGQPAKVYADGAALAALAAWLPGVGKDTTTEIATKRVSTALAEATVSLPDGEVWLGIKKA